MKVSVRLFGYLREYGKPLGDNGEIQIPPGSTVEDVIDHLNLNHSLVMLALVNGKSVNLMTGLRKDDTLYLYPIVDGG